VSAGRLMSRRISKDGMIQGRLSVKIITTIVAGLALSGLVAVQANAHSGLVAGTSSPAPETTVTKAQFKLPFGMSAKKSAAFWVVMAIAKSRSHISVSSMPKPTPAAKVSVTGSRSGLTAHTNIETKSAIAEPKSKQLMSATSSAKKASGASTFRMMAKFHISLAAAVVVTVTVLKSANSAMSKLAVVPVVAIMNATH
jgi:hypothetical protein